MCAILDANMFGEFKNQSNEDMQPVWNWLEQKNGKIAYTNTRKFEEEWERGGLTDLIQQLQRTGKLKEIPARDVRQKENEIKGNIESDDEHIIALAMVANVKVLVSNDTALHRDFKNRDLAGGKVYQTAGHKHLLTRDTCP